SVGEPTGIRSDGLALTDPYSVGVTTITWNVTDVNGNAAAEVVQTITVTDTQVPEITTNGDQAVDAAEGLCEAIVEVSANATDNCSVEEPTGIRSDGLTLTDPYPVGVTTIKWNVSDVNGIAAAEVVQTITVTDTQAPLITSNGDQAVDAAEGLCEATVEVTAIATDNCSVGEPTGIRSDGLPLTDPYPVGVTTITWNVTDVNGNAAAEVVQTITVTETQVPEITTNGDQAVDAEAGLCSAIVEVTASATDNCSVGEPTGVRSDGLELTDPYPVGITTITWNVTDVNGNAAAEVVQTITVADTQAPVITTNGDQAVDAETGLCSAIVEVTATATDNCSVGEPTGVRSDGLALTDPYPVGETTITWNVSDVNGNAAAEVTQTIRVTDTQVPVITTNGNQNIDAEAGLCSAIVEVTASATDNCSVGDPVGVRSDGLALTNPYPVGVTTITWNVSDVNGNAADEVVQTITVTDTQAPVITTNGDKNVDAETGLCSAILEVTASATDNCSVGDPVGVRSDGLPLTDPYPVGVTTIKWNVSDVNGNAATEVTQTVTVTDTEAPVITCPANISTTVAFGESGTAVSYALPIATDNCGTPSVQLISGPVSGAVFPLGTTTVTYRATDPSGNTADCSFTVTVTESADTEDPVISNCPANISVSNDAGSCGAIVNWTAPTATDNSGLVNLTSNFEPGSFFPVGTTVVTYTATDAAGNTATCSFEVIVSDNEVPNVQTRNVLIEIEAGSTYTLTLDEVDNGSSDNCGIASRTLSQTLFSDADEGENTVILTVTDIAGNQSSGSAIITVVVLSAPECVVARARDVVLVLDRNGNATLSVNQVDDGSFSNCSNRISTIEVDKISFGCEDLGEQMVTFRVTDGNGNVGEAQFKVTVLDQTAPSIGNISRINVTLNGGQTYILPDFRSTAPATDNCSVAEYIQIPDPGTVYSTAGTYPIVLRATDQSENIGERTVNLTIRINNNRPGRGRFEPIELNDLTVPWNTEFEVVIRLQRKEVGKKVMDELEVVFDKSDYDPIQPGIYTVKYYYAQAKAQVNEFKVRVEEKSLPLDISLSNNILLAELDSGSVIGRFNTLDPLDDIHIYRMEEHPELHLEGNALIWKGKGMPPATASVKVYSTDRVGQTISREISLFREITPNSILIYPNPANRETNILVNLAQESNVEIRIFDAAGRLVFTEESFQKESFARNIDLDQLSNGLYNVVVKVNNQYLQGRLVKQ
ncbi:HYR domain-containing protein, partial [Shivajiella indica]